MIPVGRLTFEFLEQWVPKSVLRFYCFPVPLVKWSGMDV